MLNYVELCISCLLHVEACQTISSNIILSRLTMLFDINRTTCQWALRGGKHQAPMYPASLPWVWTHHILIHFKITMTLWHDDIQVHIHDQIQIICMHLCIYVVCVSICPRGLRVVPPHRLGRLVWRTHTEIVIHRGPVFELSHSRLALPAPHEAEFPQLLSDISHGSHLAQAAQSKSHNHHTTHHNSPPLHVPSGLSGYVTTRPCTSRNGQLLDLKRSTATWKIGSYHRLLADFGCRFLPKAFQPSQSHPLISSWATTISTTPSVSIRPSAAAAKRFKGQACPKSYTTPMSLTKTSEISSLEIHEIKWNHTENIRQWYYVVQQWISDVAWQKVQSTNFNWAFSSPLEKMKWSCSASSSIYR